MVFSDTTNKNGAIQFCELYCGLGDAAISGDSTKLKQFTNLLNLANSQVWHLIFALNGGWKYDDSNYTDLPQATQNLTAGTSKYALPATALTVARIEVMDVTGAYHKLVPMRLDEIDVAVDEFLKSDGMPQYYRLLGGTIELFPGPATASVTTTNGLKVYFDRGISSFVSTDTTKTFGFTSEYHDIPPRKAAIEWLKIYKPDSPSLSLLVQDDVKRENELQDFEAFKFKDKPHRLQAQGRRFIWR